MSRDPLQDEQEFAELLELIETIEPSEKALEIGRRAYCRGIITLERMAARGDLPLDRLPDRPKSGMAARGEFPLDRLPDRAKSGWPLEVSPRGDLRDSPQTALQSADYDGLLN